MPEPVTTCGACGQADDHPKHQIAVGVAQLPNGEKFFHAHDFGHDGSISYHFDCSSDWHDLRKNLATAPLDAPDPAWPQGAWLPENASQHLAIAEVQEAIIAKCKSGVKGADLRAWITNLNPRGGAGGMDQTIATAILAAMAINSGTATLGTKTMTGPFSMRLMTANGSDSSSGTEQGTSGGYTAGGAALAFATASAGAVSTNAAVSWTNMPSTTLTGEEQWDASATKQRVFWGPWSGGNITVASGNTFTVASGNLTNSLA